MDVDRGGAMRNFLTGMLLEEGVRMKKMNESSLGVGYCCDLPDCGFVTLVVGRSERICGLIVRALEVSISSRPLKS